MIRVLMGAGVNTLITDNEGVRASKANGTAHIAPHTIEFKIFLLEMQQERMADMLSAAVH